MRNFNCKENFKQKNLTKNIHIYELIERIFNLTIMFVLQIIYCLLIVVCFVQNFQMWCVVLDNLNSIFPYRNNTKEYSLMQSNSSMIKRNLQVNRILVCHIFENSLQLNLENNKRPKYICILVYVLKEYITDKLYNNFK